jgi:hypothetical protein
MNYLEKSIEVDLTKVGTEIAGVLKNYVRLNWYADHTPEFYKRTEEILNSITVSKSTRVGNKFEVKIFFDEEKIKMQSSTYGKGLFGHHMSLDGSTSWDGMSIAQWVVWWMNYGQNSPLHSYEGAGFMEETMKFTEEDNYAVERLADLLRQKGFDVKIV